MIINKIKNFIKRKSSDIDDYIIFQEYNKNQTFGREYHELIAFDAGFDETINQDQLINVNPFMIQS